MVWQAQFVPVVLVLLGVAVFWILTPTATFEIRNESSRSVEIAVNTRVPQEIPPRSTATLHAGLLFGRWSAKNNSN